MEYTVFWVSAILCILIFIITAVSKGASLRIWIIGIATLGYSIAFDIFFGDVLGLYYYIRPEESTLFITLAALLIYPWLNMVYVVFLPENPIRILGYTLIWTIAMLVFEYVSVKTHVIVFTGWKPVPWSILVYTVTYGWVIILYKKLISMPHRLRLSRY